MSTPRPPESRRHGWVVGHVVGVPVIVKPSLLVAVAVLTLWLGGRDGLGSSASYVRAFLLVVLLFASVLLHELAHGLVATWRGQRPREFVLTLLGGLTAFDDEAPRPGTSALIAVAGPVVNLLLAAAFFVTLRSGLVPQGTLVYDLLWSGWWANVVVGALNLVPGLPLDGGRVLEAAVWRATGDRARGTIVAGWAGRVFAVMFFVVTFGLPLAQGRRIDLVSAVWAGLLGAFLWSGASTAIRVARSRRAVEQVSLATVGRPAVGVAHDASVAHAGAYAASVGAQEVVLLSPDGRPAAYVDRAAAATVPADVAGTTPLTVVSVPLPAGAVVDGALQGAPFVEAIAEATRHTTVVVATVDGRVVALVHATDVIAAIRP